MVQASLYGIITMFADAANFMDIKMGTLHFSEFGEEKNVLIHVSGTTKT